MNSRSKEQKMVFILGLSHTGTTLLDLTLGNHPRFLGLGEIYQVIRPDINHFENNDWCSCGKRQSECVFWGPVGKILKANKDADIKKRYELVLNAFQNMFGYDRIPIDSSKLPEALNIIRSLKYIDLKVINVIRDVRAWTIARINFRNKHQKFFEIGAYSRKLVRYRFLKIKLFNSVIVFLTKRPFYYFLLWYYQNRHIKFFLRKENISHLGISYEELGLFPDQTLDKLFQYLDTKRELHSFSSSNSESHVLYGNIKRTDPKRRKGIIYDNQWMYRHEWLFAAALFRNIMRFNTTEVYNNIRNDSIWR